MGQRGSKSAVLKIFVVVVAVTALAALATIATVDITSSTGTLLLLIVLAVLAGAHPVRLSSLRCELAATHPAILCALAGLGVLPAILTAVAGVVGSALSRSRPPATIRLLFNFASVTLATTAAGGSLIVLGGRPGTELRELLLPLAGATVVYCLVNTGLVAAAIMLERRQGFVESWRASFAWTLPSYFTGFTVAALLLLVLEALGPLGLMLGVPPTWLLIAFYRAHKERVDEQSRRIREVERLNDELERTVGDLREAVAHVRQLQGLLPICMHCKRIRDDGDAWHQIEAYLAQHSEVRFTHSLCHQCRDEHYPLMAGPP